MSLPIYKSLSNSGVRPRFAYRSCDSCLIGARLFVRFQAIEFRAAARQVIPFEARPKSLQRIQVMANKDLRIADAGGKGLNFESMLRECLACGILLVDSEDRVTALTPETERVLRLAASDEAHPLSLLPTPLQSVVREAQATRRSALERLISLPVGDTESAEYSATLLALSPPKQNIRFVVLLRKVSRFPGIENNFRRLDRLASLGTLSASMAHEIKNALVAVKTFIDLLLEKNQDAELGEVVRHEMSRLDLIVGHMLKFAAPPQPAFQLVRLHDVLDHSLRLAQHRFGSKTITFEREFNASPDELSGDDHQIEQALVNLLLNAVEAIGPEGTLTVRTDVASAANGALELREGDSRRYLRLRITDTGAGIAPEDLPHVFEPFFTTKANGTGLGLAVTRRIIEEHNGSIEVESESGKGTTFTILLPVPARPDSA